MASSPNVSSFGMPLKYQDAQEWATRYAEDPDQVDALKSKLLDFLDDQLDNLGDLNQVQNTFDNAVKYCNNTPHVTVLQAAGNSILKRNTSNTAPLFQDLFIVRASDTGYFFKHYKHFDGSEEIHPDILYNVRKREDLCSKFPKKKRQECYNKHLVILCNALKRGTLTEREQVQHQAPFKGSVPKILGGYANNTPAIYKRTYKEAIINSSDLQARITLMLRAHARRRAANRYSTTGYNANYILADAEAYFSSAPASGGVIASSARLGSTSIRRPSGAVVPVGNSTGTNNSRNTNRQSNSSTFQSSGSSGFATRSNLPTSGSAARPSSLPGAVFNTNPPSFATLDNSSNQLPVASAFRDNRKPAPKPSPVNAVAHGSHRKAAAANTNNPVGAKKPAAVSSVARNSKRKANREINEPAKKSRGESGGIEYELLGRSDSENHHAFPEEVEEGGEETNVPYFQQFFPIVAATAAHIIFSLK